MALRRIQSTGAPTEPSSHRPSRRRDVPGASSSRRKTVQDGDCHALETHRRPSREGDGRSSSRRRASMENSQRPSTSSVRRSASGVHDGHMKRFESKNESRGANRRASVDAGPRRPSRRSSIDHERHHDRSSDSKHTPSKRISSHKETKAPAHSPRAPDKEKISSLVAQISNMKRNISKGSEFTSSTGKLSSSSEMSSPLSENKDHGVFKVPPASDVAAEIPLPFLEKKVKGSSTGRNSGATPKIFDECSLFFDHEKKISTARPKFIQPKTKEDKPSKSKPSSAFREVKDSDLEDPAEVHQFYKSPVESPRISSPNGKKQALAIGAKYPPPPLNRRHTSEGQKQCNSKANPPPPPPRKQQPVTKNEVPLKSALKESKRRLSSNNSEADLTMLHAALNLQQKSYLRRSSTSLGGIRNEDNEMSTSMNQLVPDHEGDKSHSRRSSFGQSLLSLSKNDDSTPKQPSHNKRGSFGQSLLSLNESEDLVLKEPRSSFSQSMMSFNQSGDLGLDLSKSDPAGLDHAEPTKEKSHRKLSSLFGRRSTTSNSSPTNNSAAHVSSSPGPALPQIERKVQGLGTPLSTPSQGRHSRLLNHERARNSHVVNMPYTDPTYGDAGLYTGEVDADKRPNGKGKMKYDNGIFYEGKWLNGMQDAMNCANRERMLSGFSSWKGQPKPNGEKGCTVYGMEWIDLTGMAGKYTGTVDGDNLPNGKGIMKYDFGLIAEGEWIKGVLNGGSQNGQIAGGATVIPGGTVVPGAGGTVMGGGFSGGMSVVGGGAMSVVSGLGMMSISGGPQGVPMMTNPMMSQYGGMGGGMMHQMQPQMQMGQYGMPYLYDPSTIRRD